MTYSVFVDGQEGTTGLRIHEYLAQRSDITVLTIPPELRKDIAMRRELINASDVTFLCLPDAAAMESANLVENDTTCVIDASTAHRTHPAWVYGLPELGQDQRARLKTANRISNPGCHASAFVLLVKPLIATGIMPPDYPVSANSITGYSGGGKQLIQQYENANGKLNAPRPYALNLDHKHLPEMRVHSGLISEPIFTPVVGPFYKGLTLTVFLHAQLLTQKITPPVLRDLLADYYADEPFIRVMPFNVDSNTDNGSLDVEACNDTNRVDLFVFGNDERTILVARMDNLGKGASGAAIQTMNLRLGLNETLGLI